MRCCYIKSASLAAFAVLMMLMPAQADGIDSAVNAYRRSQGLSAVVTDLRLNAIAMEQARAMSAADKVSHNVARNFPARVAKLGRKVAAENVAAGFLTFPETLQQWKDSAGHRENLLILDAKRIGVASVANPGSKYRKFWAMIITD